MCKMLLIFQCHIGRQQRAGKERCQQGVFFGSKALSKPYGPIQTADTNGTEQTEEKAGKE